MILSERENREVFTVQPGNDGRLSIGKVFPTGYIYIELSRVEVDQILRIVELARNNKT